VIIRPRKPENNGWLDTRHGAFHVKVHRVKPSTYRWGRACKAYVRAAGRGNRLSMLLAHKARIPYETLQQGKARYDAFEGPVPVSYLQAIGVNFNVLQRCAEIDRVEYSEADRFGHFPRDYERRDVSSSARIPFPSFVTTFHHAVAYLSGLVERAVTPCQFTMTWPQIKSLVFKAGSPPSLELHARRPILWCDNTLMPRLGDDFDPAPDSAIQLRTTGPIEYENAANDDCGVESDIVRFLDPRRAFPRDYDPTPEQLAMFRVIIMVLDAYDPSLLVDCLRRAYGAWGGEMGFLEFGGEALRICYRLVGDQTVPDILAVLDNILDPMGRDMGMYKIVLLLIAQQILNCRRIYRGELPEPFEPVEIPQLEYLPPPLIIGVE